MPRLPAKQREAEKVATKLSNGSFAAAANDSPAQHSWEEHAKNLLSQMNGDRRKRKQTLDKFISALVKKREEFRKEKKTGAGSATEAIEFYQYVLERNAEWKAKAGKKSSKEAMSPVMTKKADDREHNSFCEVCGTGEDLLDCSTCNLAFHLGCVRPIMDEMPTDEWTCAYCNATGITHLRKDSRIRKRAINAVKEMNRMKKEIKCGQESSEGSRQPEDASDIHGGKSKDNATYPNQVSTSCKVCSKGGDLFRCNQKLCRNQFHVECIRPDMHEKPKDDWICPYCEVEHGNSEKPQARKRRSALSAIKAMEKLAEEYGSHGTSNESILSNEQTPSKRKLEDIPTGSQTPIHPGRPWSQRQQEDEEEVVDEDDDKVGADEDVEQIVAQAPEAPKFTREEIPPELLKKLLPKVTNSNSRHGQYHCKFCMDDESTETCCFCACRVCFTKHGKSKTILCDICDGEYHITCLSPPLSVIPSFDWYCPTCTEAVTRALNESSTRAAARKGGKVKGGKSISKVPAKKGATKAKAKLALKQKKSAYSATQPRTATGRFAPKPKPGEVVDVPIVKKRGPGRPPKSASKASPEKKRVTKVTEKSTLLPSPAYGLLHSTLQQRSRSGRVVKRKTAYDEREEGAQLLKVQKVLIEDIYENNSAVNKSVPSAAATLAANAVISLGPNELPSTTNNLVDSVAQNVGQSNILDQSQVSSSPKSKQVKAEVSLPDEEIMILDKTPSSSKNPRRKPGARECMQISRRFGSRVISQKYMDILMDYCSRGKVEHLIRMRERLDEHSRFLELQLAGLECLVLEKGNKIGKVAKGSGEEETRKRVSNPKKNLAVKATTKAPAVNATTKAPAVNAANVTADATTSKVTPLVATTKNPTVDAAFTKATIVVPTTTKAPELNATTKVTAVGAIAEAPVVEAASKAPAVDAKTPAPIPVPSANNNEVKRKDPVQTTEMRQPPTIVSKPEPSQAYVPMMAQSIMSSSAQTEKK